MAVGLPNSQVVAGLLGVAIGDALGVPVEFSSRAERLHAPVTTMQGWGTWNQPPGTWSDDSSLTLCLAESLCQGFSLEQIASYFCRWYETGYWTPHGQVFDVGETTKAAIYQLQQGVPPVEAGGTAVSNNGNGSLMRILPLAFFYQRWDLMTLMQRVHQVSCLTHGHWRSQIACGIYISIAVALLAGAAPRVAYEQGLQSVSLLYHQAPYATELSYFQRVCSGRLAELSEREIYSDGYTVHTLEAALWCLLTSQSYQETVLKAVNLGLDTDTTAAVAGGLAGIYYGVAGLPQKWQSVLVRHQDIVDLAVRLEQAIASGTDDK